MFDEVNSCGQTVGDNLDVQRTLTAYDARSVVSGVRCVVCVAMVVTTTTFFTTSPATAQFAAAHTDAHSQVAAGQTH